MSTQAEAVSDLQDGNSLQQFRARFASAPGRGGRRLEPKRTRCQALAEDYFCLLLFGLVQSRVAIHARALSCQWSPEQDARGLSPAPWPRLPFRKGSMFLSRKSWPRWVRELAHEIKAPGGVWVTVVCGRRWKFSPPWTERVLRAVNRMAWASVGKNGSAVKLHRIAGLRPGAAGLDHHSRPPLRAQGFEGQSSAGRVLCRAKDRLYSDDYAFLGRMLRQRIDFVMRLPGNAVRLWCRAGPGVDSAEIGLRAVVSESDGATGSQAYGIVVIRVVEIHAAGAKFLSWGTQLRQDLPRRTYRLDLSLSLANRTLFQVRLIEMILGKPPLAGRIYRA